MKLLANFIRLVPVLLLCAVGCAAALLRFRRLDNWCETKLLPTDIQPGANLRGSDVSAPARTPVGNGTANHIIAASGEIRTGHTFTPGKLATLNSKLFTR